MCYRGSEGTATGEEARLVCEAEQAILATVDNEEGARLINGLVDGYEFDKKKNMVPIQYKDIIRIQKYIQRTPLFHDLTLNNGY